LRRIPRDPMGDQSDNDASQDWALRSYASPPGQPQAGMDVFDVASRSRAIGLNGTAYSEW
jgi:general secretion pathway protein G